MRALLALLLAAAMAAPQSVPESAVAEGIRQVKEGDFEAAVITLDAAVRRLDGQPDSERLLVQAYLHLGVALVALDQREPARARFREALGLDPALRLGVEAYSPKVIAVFEEARKEASAGAAKAGSKSRGLVFLGVGVAAAGTALALRGGEADVPTAFSGARFGTRTVVCADNSIEVPVDVSVLVEGSAGSKPVTVLSATMALTVAASPDVPVEVGMVSRRATTGITPPSLVPRSRVTLRVDSTLLCTNFTGGPARFQEWTARVTLTTSEGVFNLDTSDRMRVELL